MSGQVTSHTSALSTFQGTIEAPSGLLPSEWKRPDGSRWHGIFVDSRDCLTMSFRDACLICLPLYTKSTAQSVSTQDVNICTTTGTKVPTDGTPRRRPTLTTLSLIRRPKGAMGRACSQALDSEQDTASRRALACSSSARSKSIA